MSGSRGETAKASFSGPLKKLLKSSSVSDELRSGLQRLISADSENGLRADLHELRLDVYEIAVILAHDLTGGLASIHKSDEDGAEELCEMHPLPLGHRIISDGCLCLFFVCALWWLV